MNNKLLGRSMLVTLLRVLMLVLALPLAVSAAPAPPKPKPLTQTQVIAKQQKAINKLEKKLQKKSQKLAGMTAQVKDFQDRGVADLMATEKGLMSRLVKMTKEKKKLERRLKARKKEPWSAFAKRKNIDYQPDPPAGSPPPPPPPAAGAALATPSQPIPAARKDFLPPGGPKVAARPNLDF